MSKSGPRKFNVDRDWFERLYLVDLMPTPHLAREIGCCNEHVNFLARKFGIPVRPRQREAVKRDHLRLNMDEVKRLYLEEMMPCSGIAKIMGCEGSAINRRLKDAGVNLRHHNDTKRGKPAKHRIDIDPDLVAKLYAEPNASGQTVADKFGVSRQVVDRILRESGISKKPLGETRDYWGANSPNWNPDITDEERQSRRDIAAQKDWRAKIFARDGHTCQKCRDSKGGNLNAHHIVPHCANKAIAWRLDNGVTLCVQCHRTFHSTYGLKRCGPSDLQEFLS